MSEKKGKGKEKSKEKSKDVFIMFRFLKEHLFLLESKDTKTQQEGGQSDEERNPEKEEMGMFYHVFF